MHDTQGVGVSFARGCAGLVDECRIENTGVPGLENLNALSASSETTFLR